MEDIYLVLSPLDGYDRMICKGNNIFNVKYFDVDDWIQLLPLFVENVISEDTFCISKSLYDLKILGYKFKWETITEIVRNERFDLKRGIPFLQYILSDMEGIEIKELNDIETIYKNSQTNESIKITNFPIDPKLYFNDVEIKGEN